MTRHYKRQSPVARPPPIEERTDRRPELTVYIGPQIGPALVHWLLVPRQGRVRQYRVVDPRTREPIVVDDKPLGGGRDKIVREAIKLMPRYVGLRRVA